MSEMNFTLLWSVPGENVRSSDRTERRRDVDASIGNTHLKAEQDHGEEIQEPIDDNKYKSRD